MGGLSVLHRALRMLPEADFLYYADEEHVPYGEKTREQVRGYIDEIIAFMIKKQVDAIVDVYKRQVQRTKHLAFIDSDSKK